MAKLENSIDTIIKVFHQYAEKEGHDTLSQKKFREMAKKELPNFLKKENRKESLINDIMEDLDTNQDKQLSFEEFSMLMAKMVYATHEKMHQGEENRRGENHKHGPGLGQKKVGV